MRSNSLFHAHSSPASQPWRSGILDIAVSWVSTRRMRPRPAWSPYLFSCGPAVLPPWGGDQKLLSTSPIAAGFPLRPAARGIDLALSTVTRGKIAAYAQRGKRLPDGCALDADRQPTTDATRH